MTKFLKYALPVAISALMAACSGDDPAPQPEPTPDPENPQGSNSMVIYEANPLFFATDNCFAAIEARLPQIKSMGPNVLWIMPINAQGQKNAIGSPYCVKDYKGLNPKYGEMTAFKSLVNKAHAAGMIVIIDWVANHTAWDNPWITEHPDWFTRQNGQIVSPPGMGWNDVADLNYNNQAMRAAMIDAMTYWIKQAGIDGFRCDYAEGVPHDFWKEAVKSIRAVKPDAFMLAEGSDMALYADGFDMIYDWSYCTDMQKYFKGSMTFEKFIENADAKVAKLPEGKEIMRYVVNHDVISEQSPVQLYGSNAAIEPAYVLTAFLGQTPLIYSGMEAGFDNRTAFINARPLTWNPEIFKQYVAIENAYKATATARAGKRSIYATNPKAAVFAKVNGDKAVLVMVNRTAENVEVKVPMIYAGLNMTDAISGTSATVPSVVTLPPYGYRIFSK